MYKLDASSELPLYLQIVDQTKLGIGRGYFQEGDQMPSIRELSKTLLVNQSTVSKAYRELESQGFIETVAGRGTFISLDRSKIDLERDRLVDELRDLMEKAVVYGVSKEEMMEIYEDVSEEVGQ